MARTWVLLRGLARQAEHWGPFIDQFQHAFPDDKILTPDLPGVGRLRNETSPADVGKILERVRGQVLKETTEPVSIFAVSLGGMISLSWLEKYPKEIREAYIVNTSSTLSPFYHRLRWEIWKPFASILITRDPKESEKKVLELISNSEENRQKILPLWEQIRRESPVKPQTPILQIRAASRFQVPENQPQFQKVKFFVGLGDRLVEPACTLELAEHFHVPVVKHPWAGHDLPIDDPQWLLEQVKSFSTQGIISESR